MFFLFCEIRFMKRIFFFREVKLDIRLDIEGKSGLSVS